MSSALFSNPAILAALGSMTGTLGGATSMEGVENQQQQDLQDRAKAAAEAASQAGAQYTQATQQPMPQVNPGQQFAANLLGNTASVLSGNQAYHQQAQQQIEAQRQQLVQQRVENLQALRDQYDQKARAAEQLGNTEMAGELRLKQEQIGKMLQSLYDVQHQSLIGARQADLEKLRQTGREELLDLKAKYGMGTASPDDVKKIGDAIISGEQPPTMVGMGRGGAVVRLRSYLADKGYDLYKSTLDYNAHTRFIATLNGRQQVQIRQSASTIEQGLDKLDQLNDQLSKLIPRFAATPLNRISTGAARELGSMGPEAQKVASQMTSLIADIIPEMANVYQAGGVPTDRSMILAAKALSADWGHGRLKAGTQLARTQLAYRLNSIRSATSLDESGNPIPTRGEGPNIELAGDLMRALNFAQAKDQESFREYVQQHPEINENAQIIAAARKNGWIK